MRFSILFFSLFGLTALSAGPKGKTPPPVSHELQAEIKRATALESLKAGALKDAAEAIDAAIAAESTWGELYFIRADIRSKRAGPESAKEALAKATAGVDYARLSELLTGAAADLQKYLELTPAAPDRAAAIAAIGELNLRASLANGGVARQRQQEEDRKLLNSGRVKVDGEHWCFPRQVFREGRCLGVPQCPGMLMVSGESCIDSPCVDGTVRGENGRCCWPGQRWTEERFEQNYAVRRSLVTLNPLSKPFHLSASAMIEYFGCTGLPSCPAGMLALPGAGFAEMCVKPPKHSPPARSQECVNSTNGQRPHYVAYDEQSLPVALDRNGFGTRLDAFVSIATAEGCTRHLTSGFMTFCCP